MNETELSFPLNIQRLIRNTEYRRVSTVERSITTEKKVPIEKSTSLKIVLSALIG